MNKELEVHSRTQSQATQALQASEDQCYQAQKDIQHGDWVLKNIIAMKDTRYFLHDCCFFFLSLLLVDVHNV